MCRKNGEIKQYWLNYPSYTVKKPHYYASLLSLSHDTLLLWGAGIDLDNFCRAIQRTRAAYIPESELGRNGLDFSLYCRIDAAASG